MIDIISFLQVVYPDKSEALINNKDIIRTPVNLKASSSVVPSLIPAKSIQPYALNDVKQKQFNNNLLRFVVNDSTPLNITQGKGFKNLIASLDPKLRLPSRRTIGRHLDKKYSEVH